MKFLLSVLCLMTMNAHASEILHSCNAEANVLEIEKVEIVRPRNVEHDLLFVFYKDGKVESFQTTLDDSNLSLNYVAIDKTFALELVETTDYGVWGEGVLSFGTDLKQNVEVDCSLGEE